MRNRLNVHWQGKRTTARFPEYLWQMAMVAMDLSDDALADDVQEHLARVDHRSIAHLSASDVVKDYLVIFIMAALPSSQASIRGL